MVNATTWLSNAGPKVRALTWALIVVAVTAAYASKLAALSVGPLGVDEGYEYSDAVAFVEIERYHSRSVDGHSCGVQYTAKIVEAFKLPQGHRDPSLLVFGRFAGLEVGERYLIFLNNINDPEEYYYSYMYDMKPGDGENKALMTKLIQCEDMIPGLFFRQEHAWQELFDDENQPVFFFQYHRPRPMPASIKVRELGDLQWTASSDDVFSYLRRLR
jgi:hypothetical protein